MRKTNQGCLMFSKKEHILDELLFFKWKILINLETYDSGISKKWEELNKHLSYAIQLLYCIKEGLILN